MRSIFATRTAQNAQVGVVRELKVRCPKTISDVHATIASCAGLADPPCLPRGQPSRERARTIRSLVPPNGDVGRSVRAGLGRSSAASCRASHQESPELRRPQRPFYLDLRRLLSCFAEAPALVPSVECPLSVGARGRSHAPRRDPAWCDVGAPRARTTPSGGARPPERASPGNGGASRHRRAERRRDRLHRRKQRDDRSLAPARRPASVARLVEC
jgi:hypothetical protein